MSYVVQQVKENLPYCILYCILIYLIAMYHMKVYLWCLQFADGFCIFKCDYWNLEKYVQKNSDDSDNYMK